MKMEYLAIFHVHEPHNKNGVVDRKNRTLQKMATMLNESNVEKYF